MIKLGIGLLVAGILVTIVTSSMDSEVAGLKYFQVGGFLLGVVGLFFMETNRRKRFKK